MSPTQSENLPEPTDSLPEQTYLPDPPTHLAYSPDLLTCDLTYLPDLPTHLHSYLTYPHDIQLR